MEMENKLTPELIAKAKQAKSPEELSALAKENGMEFTEENAKACFEQLHKSGELSDDELDNVAGGLCHKDGKAVVIPRGFSCRYWTCKKCGSGKNNKCSNGNEHWSEDCMDCKYCSRHDSGLWLCSNPKKI